MTMLTKIGNSQGVRIPKSLIQQAGLEGSRIEFELLEDGLLLKPVKKNTRECWADNIKQILDKNSSKVDERELKDMLNDSDLEDLQW